jgi:hypothetical protein
MIIKNYKQFESKEDLDPYGEENWENDWQTDDPETNAIINKLIDLGVDFNIQDETRILEQEKGNMTCYAIYAYNDFIGIYNARSEREAELLAVIETGNDILIDYDLDVYVADRNYIQYKIDDLEYEMEKLYKIKNKYEGDPFSVNDI